MALGAGRTGVAAGMERCLGGVDAVERDTGLDDGFLNGRLGRTRLERFIAAGNCQKHINYIKSVY